MQQLLAAHAPRVLHKQSTYLRRQLEEIIGGPFDIYDIRDVDSAEELGEIVDASCADSAFDELLRQDWVTFPSSGEWTNAVIRFANEGVIAVGRVGATDLNLLNRLIRTSIRLVDQERQIQQYANESAFSAEELCRLMEEQTWLQRLIQQMDLKGAYVDAQPMASQMLVSLRHLVRAKAVALFDRVPEPWTSGEPFTCRWVGKSLVPNSEWQHWLCQLDLRIAPRRRVYVVNQDAIDSQLRDHGVDSLLAAPIGSIERLDGWLVAVNRRPHENEQTELPDVPNEFGTVEAGVVETAAILLGTHRQNVELLRSQQELGIGVIRSMSSAIDARDPYTQGHSERVGFVSRHIARRLGHSKQECDRIFTCGLLHDIGKIGVPDRVLSKPGKLTDEEFALIKQHPQIGYDIVRNLPTLEDLLPGILHHHEAIDGTGYPHGLAGEAIPLQARILAVADAFDAMTSDRPYRAGMSYERACEILRDGAGVQWDRDVVNAFLQMHAG